MNELYRQYLIDGERHGAPYALSVTRSAPTGVAGSQLGRAAGSSLEFMDHREYQPGDDLRRIDWGALARTDRLIVRLYREEVTPHLDLLLDGSRSMALEGSAKAQATLSLAGLLAAAAGNTGYTHCAWITAETCRKIPNGTLRPPAWDEIAFEDTNSPAGTLAQMPPAWRRQGIRILLSDLLWLGDPMTLLSLMAQGASAVVVVQVLAEADMNPPEHGNIRLVDSESGDLREIFIDGAAQQRYRSALARHQQNWHRACRQIGARLTTIVAEPFLESWDLGEWVAAEILKVK